MVAGPQKLEEPRFRSVFGHGLHPHRPQSLERTFNRTLVVSDGGSVTIAQGVDRSRPARRQLHVASSLQFEQQTPSGHVFEPAGAIAPIPSQTQFTGKSRPIGLGMSSQPVSD